MVPSVTAITGPGRRLVLCCTRSGRHGRKSAPMQSMTIDAGYGVALSFAMSNDNPRCKLTHAGPALIMPRYATFRPR
jgi:hypothetical protein